MAELSSHTDTRTGERIFSHDEVKQTKWEHRRSLLLAVRRAIARRKEQKKTT